MEALLKITTIPLEYEMRIEPAKLEYGDSALPVVEIKREKGGLKIKSTPARLRIDTFEARNSVMPTLASSIRNLAQKGKAAAQEAVQRYASETAQMRWSKPGEGGRVLQQIFRQRSELPKGDFQMGFLPAAKAEITYQPGDLSIDYQMDRLLFEFKMNRPKGEYTAGSIQMIITQYPDVKVEYMGKPHYVPPSAAPGWEEDGIDLLA